MSVGVAEMSHDLTTGVIIFVYVFIAMMAVFTGIVALFFWELIQSFRHDRRRK